MTITELMNGRTVNADYEGIATTDDFVLAIKTATTQTDPKQYIVVQGGVTSYGASISSETEDKQYIRTGKSTSRKDAQRKFTVAGDRMCADDAQEFLLDLKFATGGRARVDYVYFNILTGKGEQGTLTVDVTEDAGGDAGSNATFSINLAGTQKPSEYVYSA